MLFKDWFYTETKKRPDKSIDNWLKEADALKKSLSVLKDAIEKKKKEPKKEPEDEDKDKEEIKKDQKARKDQDSEENAKELSRDNQSVQSASPKQTKPEKRSLEVKKATSQSQRPSPSK